MAIHVPSLNISGGLTLFEVGVFGNDKMVSAKKRHKR